MGRSRRPHLPGVPFHLIARIQGKAPLLVGIERYVLQAALYAAESAGGDLLAYAVMPNHLHLVYTQGTAPLSRFMQPLLCRVALFIQRRQRTDGHVFGHRFRSLPCTDPDYLRNVITYVHLNPVRGKLCETADAYPWTSHGAFCSAQPQPEDLFAGPAGALRLFAPAASAEFSEMRGNYRRYIGWRVRMDAYDPTVGVLPPACPDVAGGDAYWVRRYAWACTGHPQLEQPLRPAIDLRDVARRVLRELAPEMSLDLLRSGARSRPVVAVRRHVIRTARESGHRNRAIARFLNISDSTVSQA